MMSFGKADRLRRASRAADENWWSPAPYVCGTVCSTCVESISLYSTLHDAFECKEIYVVTCTVQYLSMFVCTFQHVYPAASTYIQYLAQHLAIDAHDAQQLPVSPPYLSPSFPAFSHGPRWCISCSTSLLAATTTVLPAVPPLFVQHLPHPRYCTLHPAALSRRWDALADGFPALKAFGGVEWAVIDPRYSATP
jgi:hypothetical protein